ncbi:hypothetical protein [Homoserinimonas sp. OAct 916]|uniref:hypothetical protein n=1 Tax=Homoserinimonas sp. OAct 916 TaxID=2211450 RepID=UPI000DBE3A9F|nr:hypothetical protein [Homoserinimonas sp. OAct 916]
MTRFSSITAITFSTAILLLVAGCSATTVQPPVAKTAAPEAGFGHVHALGVDRQTGETFAATHNGVWTVPTGDLPETYLTGAPRSTQEDVIKVGDGSQDTMGFVVAHPGLLLASGHPAPGEQPDLARPNLGLISSTDSAKTWASISLHGETDFHDIDAVMLPNNALRVFGYDSGTGEIKVSDDGGATWATGASIPLRNLVADPTEPDRVFATTEQGLMVSNDGARSFVVEPNAPMLYLIDAVDPDEGGGFIGIGIEGDVWHQNGATGEWFVPGKVESVPEAFSYAGGDEPWILVSNERGISASPDYGQTWVVLAPSKE